MKYLFTLAALSMTACFNSEKEEDTSSTSDSNFAPQTGTWLMSVPEITSDNCGIYDGSDSGYEEGDEPMDISLNADGTYSVTMGSEEGSTTLSCSLSGHDFSCAAAGEPEAISENAMLIQSYAIDGSFSSSTEFAGSIALDMSCEGSDCDALGAQIGFEFPCVLAGTMTASYSN